MVQPAFVLEREPHGEGAALTLRGRCHLEDGPALWADLQAELAERSELELDLTELESLDGACAALLLATGREARARGGDLRLVGARPECGKMLALYSCDSDVECMLPPPTKIGIFNQIGGTAVGLVGAARDVLSFFGDLICSLRLVIRDRGSVNWHDVPQLMERAGPDGVPIVLLINFLVGLIVGLQSAYQLQRFGADIFIADAVGLTMARELAPLMTAIVVAGRSGAAYAAELGTMKVNQEIDALWTLGFDPHRFLVFPRIIAMAVVVPLLTLASIVVGIIGGLLIAVGVLGLSPVAYFTELESAVGVMDIVGGLIKSVVFAVTITLISCQRGLATVGGAAGVGRSTTSAVVIVLFAIVVLDTVFGVAYNFFGI